MYAASKPNRRISAAVVAAATLACLATGCTSHPPITGTPAPLHSAAHAATESINDRISTAATRQIDTAYAWGGGNAAGPTHGITPDDNVIGFDSSGLIVAVVATATDRAVILTHSIEAQRADARLSPVGWSQRRPGDLVFFVATDTVAHVGILDGRDDVISAVGPHTGVRRDAVAAFTGPGLSVVLRRVTGGPSHV